MKPKLKKRFLAGLLCVAGLLGGVFPVRADDFGRIPYAAIEGILRDLIASQVNGRFNGKEVCPTVFCPDATWRADVSSNIRFTKNIQPTLTPMGPSPWIDGFRINLETQIEVSLYADAYIEIGGPAKDISFNMPINKLIGVHLSAIVYTEPAPELKSDSIAFSLSDDGGNVQINGLNGDMTILGIEAGAIAGLVLVGDPITGGILGAVLGNKAANIAKDKIRAEVSQRAAVAISQASFEGNNQLRKYVIPNIQRVNSVLALLPAVI